MSFGASAVTSLLPLGESKWICGHSELFVMGTTPDTLHKRHSCVNLSSPCMEVGFWEAIWVVVSVPHIILSTFFKVKSIVVSALPHFSDHRWTCLTVLPYYIQPLYWARLGIVPASHRPCGYCGGVWIIQWPLRACGLGDFPVCLATQYTSLRHVLSKPPDSVTRCMFWSQ